MKKWCENILVVVMISSILEMLLPEGKSQKYIKVVLGLYLVFTILQPMLTFIKNPVFSEEFIPNTKSIEENTLSRKEQESYLNAIGENLKQK